MCRSKAAPRPSPSRGDRDALPGRAVPSPTRTSIARAPPGRRAPCWLGAGCHAWHRGHATRARHPQRPHRHRPGQRDRARHGGDARRAHHRGGCQRRHSRRRAHLGRRQPHALSGAHRCVRDATGAGARGRWRAARRPAGDRNAARPGARAGLRACRVPDGAEPAARCVPTRVAARGGIRRGAGGAAPGRGARHERGGRAGNERRQCERGARRRGAGDGARAQPREPVPRLADGGDRRAAPGVPGRQVVSRRARRRGEARHHRARAREPGMGGAPAGDRRRPSTRSSCP